jgi:hypothetical protein
MDFFSYSNEKWGKNQGLFLGFFWCGFMNIYNNNLVCDALKKGKIIYSHFHKYTNILIFEKIMIWRFTCILNFACMNILI